jgi:hypothetical protein
MVSWLTELPASVDGLRRVARNLVIHYRGDDPVGQGIPIERMAEIDTRYAAAMLHRLHDLDRRPLTVPRPPVKRLVGCCRDFTVLFVTLARHQGIPARSRVGFATYFIPGYAVDHEIAEVWDEAEQRWRLVDTELGDTHIDPNDGVVVDGLDVPRDRFLVAGRAWLACQNGTADPERFVVDPNLMIPETRSWRQIRHNLLHDLARLNRQELLLWDVWGLDTIDELSAAQARLIEDIARITAADEVPWEEAIAVYEDHPELRVPQVITSHDPMGGPPREVLLAQ